MIKMNNNIYKKEYNTNYIKQLEEENKLLKHKLVNEMEYSNRILMTEKMKNKQLSKENLYLRQKLALLNLINN